MRTERHVFDAMLIRVSSAVSLRKALHDKFLNVVVRLLINGDFRNRKALIEVRKYNSEVARPTCLVWFNLWTADELKAATNSSIPLKLLSPLSACMISIARTVTATRSSKFLVCQSQSVDALDRVFTESATDSPLPRRWSDRATA